MRRPRRRPARLHLLEVGVQWPPETFLRRKLQGLAARGVRVTVASKLVYDATATVEGVELVRIPERATAPRLARDALALLVTSPRRLVRLWRNVRRAPSTLFRRHGGTADVLAMYLPLARLRPDVVQFEWNVAAVDHLPVFDVLGCPILTSCRGSDITVYPHIPTFHHYASGLPEVIRRASAVHCVSESLKRDAAGFGLDPAKARVIRPAVDADAFRPAPAAPGREGDVLRVVSVGWLRWEKGHEYALQAIHALVQRGVPVRFEILGGVPEASRGKAGERERILHTVVDLGLEEHVGLHGQATPAEVGHRLAEADAFLHASVAEGIPNVVLEAMACAVPVVTSDCGGVSEAVTDGVEGFVVGPRDPDGLAGALERLWSDRPLARRMGNAGRERVRLAFTPDHHIDQFLDLYREVAGAR
jgi:colanic acid/amylovoran biosynthesis glycosyltransferase